MAASFALPQQTSFATNFSICPSDVYGTQIQVHFDTMPGNMPSAYGNTLFLWQTGAQIVPMNVPPESSESIGTNQPDADWLFMNLDITSEPYLVAYAVGSDPRNIVSTVFIPGDMNSVSDLPAMNPSLTVTLVGLTSVAFNYSLPDGLDPQGQGDWVGLWQATSESGLYSNAPTWAAKLNSVSSRGAYGLNLASGAIQPGVSYTLGYFKGGWDQSVPTASARTALACSTTFSGG